MCVSEVVDISPVNLGSSLSFWSHHFMENRWGNNGNSDRLYFWELQNQQMVTAAKKLKDACSLEEKL